MYVCLCVYDELIKELEELIYILIFPWLENLVMSFVMIIINLQLLLTVIGRIQTEDYLGKDNLFDMFTL